MPYLDLPQGTLDLLILRALLTGAQHGWAISERVQQVSDDVLRIQQGSLYPALHRLERRGWITAEWGVSDNNRKAKYYELTRSGTASAGGGDGELAQADGGGGPGAGEGVSHGNAERGAVPVAGAVPARGGGGGAGRRAAVPF